MPTSYPVPLPLQPEAPDPLDPYRRPFPIPAAITNVIPRMLDATRHGLMVSGLYSQSGFSMNYDEAGPVRKIDLAAPDEAEKSGLFALCIVL
jgi:hypothetical protein